MTIIEQKPQVITQVVDFNENIKKWLFENGFEETDNYDSGNEYKTIRYRHKELPLSIATDKPNSFGYNFHFYIATSSYVFENQSVSSTPFGNDRNDNLVEFIDDTKMRLIDACLLAKEFLIMIKGEK